LSNSGQAYFVSIPIVFYLYRPLSPPPYKGGGGHIFTFQRWSIGTRRNVTALSVLLLVKEGRTHFYVPTLERWNEEKCFLYKIKKAGESFDSLRLCFRGNELI